jgi:hypothetical protein
VQVGAFKDAATAQRVASRLREQGFQVAESTRSVNGAVSKPTVAAAPADRYDVVVSGAPAAEITAKLTAKGLNADTGDAGVVVRPSLPLRDAVALSRELADAGLSVQVRRVGAAPPRPTTAESPATLHRVRVGGFADRPAALATVKQLEEKGYRPFVARGSE